MVMFPYRLQGPEHLAVWSLEQLVYPFHSKFIRCSFKRLVYIILKAYSFFYSVARIAPMIIYPSGVQKTH